MSSKIVVDEIESNAASTAAITLDGNGTGVYKATSVETPNIKHASSSSNNIVLASDGSVSIPSLTLPAKTSGETIEKIVGVCDGRTVTGKSGSYTLENVTAKYEPDTTYSDLTGSSISYTPPTGTKTVIYKFHACQNRDGSGQTLWHAKFLIDGVEASKYRFSRYSYYGSPGYIDFKYVIDCNASATDASADYARFTSWTSAKTLKIQVRTYDGSNIAEFHDTRYWDGATASHLVLPNLEIEALA